VYAAVHLLHDASTEKAAARTTASDRGTDADSASPSLPPNLDINVLGETLTEIAKEHTTQRPIVEPGYSGLSMTTVQNVGIQRQAALGDYLRLDQPETLRAVRARLLAVAAIPGLTGLVARDCLPPGYSQGDMPYYDSSGSDDNEFGYTPEMRLTMLRRFGSDPIDLPRGGDSQYWNFARYSGDYGSIDLGLPFFRDAGRSAGMEYVEGVGMVQKGGSTPIMDWNALRRETAEGMLNQVLKAIKNDPAGGRLRLLREVNLSYAAGGSLFDDREPWTPPSAKNAAGAAAAPPPATSRKAYYYGMPVGDMDLVMSQMQDLKPIQRFALAIGGMIRYGGQRIARGVVMDVTSLKPEEAVSFLSVFKEAPVTASAGKAAAGTR